LLIPNGAFYNETGGAWVFVVAPDGKSAVKRQVRSAAETPILSKCSTASSRASASSPPLYRFRRQGSAGPSLVNKGADDYAEHAWPVAGLPHRHGRDDRARLRSTSTSPTASSSRSWARRAAASRPCSTSWECSIARRAAPTCSTAVEVAGLPEAKLADIRKQNIGFIFQSFNLVDELSVRENVELALLYHDVAAAERARASTR
jgi:hypothetical protein